MDLASSIDSWMKLNEMILKSSFKNECVTKILQNNIAAKTAEKDFLNLSDNLKNLIQVKFENSRFFSGVLRIVMEFSAIIQKYAPANYVECVKIFMTIIKTNQDLITNEPHILEFPVSLTIGRFSENFMKVNSNYVENQFHYLLLQLKIVIQLQKMFEGNFRGTSHIANAIVDLQYYASTTPLNNKLKEPLRNLKAALWTELGSTNFYTSFFTKLEDATKLQFANELCVEVFEKIAESNEYFSVALSTEINSNFCLLAIKFLANNPQIIQIHPETLTRIAQKISQLLCSPNISVVSFEFIEREIVKSLLSDNFWTSEVSFVVFLDILETINSNEIVAQYFVSFQKILKKLWIPSTSFSNRSQLVIAQIVLFIARRHPTIARKNMVDRSFLEILMKASKSDSQVFFKNSLALLLNAPTVSNYYNMQLNLKLLSFDMAGTTEESLAKVCNLISFTKECDWFLHSDLMILIMEIIIATNVTQCKLFLLLKFYESLNNEIVMPFEVKLKLLELLVSCISLAESHVGIQKLLHQELGKLLMNGPENIKNVILDEFNEETIVELMEMNSQGSNSYTDRENLNLEILESSKNAKFNHVCPNILHSVSKETSQHSKRLQMIQGFLKSLQSGHLTELDRQLLQQIHITANELNR